MEYIGFDWLIAAPVENACCPNTFGDYAANVGWLIVGAEVPRVKLPGCFYSIVLFPNELLDNVGLLSKLRFPNILPSIVYGFAATLKSIFPGTDWLIG